MNKRFVVLVVALLLVVLLSACEGGSAGSAFDDPSVPKFDTDTGYVIDVTGQLSAEYENQLEGMLGELDDRGWQTVIGVFDNLANDPILFGTKVMNENGIGSSELDDGLVIVVFVEKEGSDGNKPSIGVAVGSGLEGDFNDARVGRMLDNTYVPPRADGKWEEGLISFVTAYAGLRSGTDNWEQYPEQKTEIDPAIIMLVIALIVIFLVADGSLTGFQMTMILVEIGASSIGGGGSGRGGGSSR